MIYFFNRNFCSSLTLWPKAPAPFPLVNLCSRCFPSSECLVSSYLVLSIQASPIQLERFPSASLTPPRRTSETLHSLVPSPQPPRRAADTVGFCFCKISCDALGSSHGSPPQLPELVPQRDALCRVSQRPLPGQAESTWLGT